MGVYRKDARAVVQLKARYRSPTVFKFVEDECYDLSKGGMFMATASPADVGTLIKFECEVDGSQLFRGVGRVVWIRDTAQGEGKPGGMAVKFVKLEDGAAELIARVVRQHGPDEGAGPEGRSSIPPQPGDETRSSAPPPPKAGKHSSAPPPAAESPGAGDAVSRAEAPSEEGADATASDPDPPAAPHEAPTRAGFEAVQTKDESSPDDAGSPAAPEGKRAPRSTPPARAVAPQAGRPPKRSAVPTVVLAAVVLLGLAAWLATSRDSGEGSQAGSETPAEAPASGAVTTSTRATTKDAPPSPPVEPQVDTAAAQQQADAAVPDAAVPDAGGRPVEDAEPTATGDGTVEAADAPDGQMAADAPEANAARVASTDESSGAQPRYLLQVVTTPKGARVVADDEAITAPGTLRRTDFSKPVKVYASKNGYRATATVVEPDRFELEDGALRGRIYLVLHRDATAAAR